MKRAFDEDSRRHLNEPTGGPDGYDNGDFLRKYALSRKSDAYKVSWNGKPVGAVIVWINKNNINYLGNIFIDPDLQDKGFGKKVWEFIKTNIRYSNMEDRNARFFKTKSSFLREQMRL